MKFPKKLFCSELTMLEPFNTKLKEVRQSSVGERGVQSWRRWGMLLLAFYCPVCECQSQPGSPPPPPGNHRKGVHRPDRLACGLECCAERRLRASSRLNFNENIPRISSSRLHRLASSAEPRGHRSCDLYLELNRDLSKMLSCATLKRHITSSRNTLLVSRV